ncbi:MAG: polyamine aminopropyltransferase, partial [Myxococcota bacterium]|nr:polyamine aminopropyltransferase [Myxococcota bacterium]
MRLSSGQEDISRPLFVSAFVIATCGLIYELIAGAMASYLLGDSITQFSLIIGIYLSAMGVGAYFSKYISRNLIERFVEIELAVAIIGGFEAALLFTSFAYSSAFQWVLFGLVFIIGMLVGTELPLLIRILEKQTDLKELVARVFFLDYIGALAASLTFPIVLVPYLGLLRSSMAFGILNAAVALWTTFLFRAPRAVLLRLRILSGLTIVALVIGLGGASWFEKTIDAALFADPVVFHQRTPYQKLTLTHRGGDTRLYINGALQFSSVDEYRYHEALVHPTFVNRVSASNVLVLGGGDGLAVREILKYPEVEKIVLVDLDPEMTRLFRDHDILSKLNQEAFQNPKVEVINEDAFTWLQRTQNQQFFDIVIIDFPDPNNYSLGKLYSNHFFRMLRKILHEDSVLSIQSTSPMFSPNSFWCIAKTIAHENFHVKPYHVYVPTFGEWGFILASPQSLETKRSFLDSLKFLDANIYNAMFHFPKDMTRNN